MSMSPAQFPLSLRDISASRVKVDVFPSSVVQPAGIDRLRILSPAAHGASNATPLAGSNVRDVTPGGVKIDRNRLSRAVRLTKERERSLRDGSE